MRFYRLLVAVVLAGSAAVSSAREPPLPPAPDLKNPGFEHGSDDWSVQVYGARPTITRDGAIAHERIRGTGHSQNGGKMACRCIEYGFRKEKWTGCLRPCANDFMVKALGVSDASI